MCKMVEDVEDVDDETLCKRCNGVGCVGLSLSLLATRTVLGEEVTATSRSCRVYLATAYVGDVSRRCATVEGCDVDDAVGGGCRRSRRQT